MGRNSGKKGKPIIHSKGLRSSASGGVSQKQNSPVPSTSAAAAANQFSQPRSPPQAEDALSDCDEITEYGPMHRCILQGIMAAGFLDSTGVKCLFNKAFKHLKQRPPEQKLIYPFIQKVVREINAKIMQFDMSIRSSTCEITGDKYYVFLITIEKQMMKLQTFFTKTELELFQKIMDFIIRKTHTFNISMMDCVNLNDELENSHTSKVDAEDFVRRLILMQYLTEVPHPTSSGRFDITLGFRTVREFEPIFREDYPQIFVDCCLCKMILLNGYSCPNCQAVIHKACLKKYYRSCKTCVVCKCAWRSQDALAVRTRDPRDDNVVASTSASLQNMMLTPSTSRPGRGQAKKGKRQEHDMETADIAMPVLHPMQPQPVADKNLPGPSRPRPASPAKSVDSNEELGSRYINSSSESD